MAYFVIFLFVVDAVSCLSVITNRLFYFIRYGSCANMTD